MRSNKPVNVKAQAVTCTVVIVNKFFVTDDAVNCNKMPLPNPRELRPLVSLLILLGLKSIYATRPSVAGKKVIEHNVN